MEQHISPMIPSDDTWRQKNCNVFQLIYKRLINSSIFFLFVAQINIYQIMKKIYLQI